MIACRIVTHTLEWKAVIIERGKDVVTKARRAINVLAINLDGLRCRIIANRTQGIVRGDRQTGIVIQKVVHQSREMMLSFL